jgi:thiol-disulfide isomerase/thioredoxin
MNRLISYKQILLISILLVSIYGVGKAQTTPNDNASCTEDKNMIIGKTTLDQLSQNTEFWAKYLTYYASYSMDKKKLDEISNLLRNRNIHIIAVIGTWCGDTKEQFPVLQKILDHLQLNNISIEYIGVNRDKLAGETDISLFGIIFVPTFIFYEDNQELGRIVETPEETMENHILKIISKQ